MGALFGFFCGVIVGAVAYGLYVGSLKIEVLRKEKQL